MVNNVSVLSLRVVKEREVSYEPTSSPGKVYKLLEESFSLSELAEEVFILLSLNSKKEPTGIFKVAQGSINKILVHPREVYKRAIANNAASIIVAHNHPSGHLEPSKEDVEVTARLKAAGELLGVELLDHLIIGDFKYLSFREEGIF